MLRMRARSLNADIYSSTRNARVIQVDSQLSRGCHSPVYCFLERGYGRVGCLCSEWGPGSTCVCTNVAMMGRTFGLEANSILGHLLSHFVHQEPTFTIIALS